MKPNYTGFSLAEIHFNTMLNKGHTESSADHYAMQGSTVLLSSKKYRAYSIPI